MTQTPDVDQRASHGYLPSGDIRNTLVALKSGQTSLAEVWERAGAIAASDACRHVYMPGNSSQTLRTIAVPAVSNPPGQPEQPLTGIPVSVKDLFDVAGQTTRAGSAVLAGQPPASADCAAVARLRLAGAVIAGRTNMVEFAFSGVGINPHYGTPVNSADRRIERIPGGSSSGAAVSVATGAAFAGLGSDTGGSLRVPAALCGIVGFKSTARLVPATGAVPLSTSLDTVGALTRSVRDAITLHEVLSGQQVSLSPKPLAGLRLAVCSTLMQDVLDDTVARAFDKALSTLRQAGAQIEELAVPELNDLSAINASGGLSAAESYAWHRTLIGKHQAAYDPRVAVRILRGASMSAADYIDLLAARQEWIGRMQARLNRFDVVLSPTVALVAPPIASVLHDDAEFFRINALLLRNTSVVNMLDGCGISIPCHAPGQLPVGLMLWHTALRDVTVLGSAIEVEAALAAALLA